MNECGRTLGAAPVCQRNQGTSSVAPQKGPRLLFHGDSPHCHWGCFLLPTLVEPQAYKLLQQCHHVTHAGCSNISEPEGNFCYRCVCGGSISGCTLSSSKSCGSGSTKSTELRALSEPFLWFLWRAIASWYGIDLGAEPGRGLVEWVMERKSATSFLSCPPEQFFLTLT